MHAEKPTSFISILNSRWQSWSGFLFEKINGVSSREICHIHCESLNAQRCQMFVVANGICYLGDNIRNKTLFNTSTLEPIDIYVTSGKTK